MSHVLAVANQKGGVAKTTTVASLGVALAEAGRRVLLVDLDPQACLTFSLGLDPDELPMSVHDVLLGRVSARTAVRDTADGPDILPASIELAGCEAVLVGRRDREKVLADALAPLLGSYDDVLIDCAPSLGVLTLNGLTAADEVLVPLAPETLAHRGVGQLMDTVQDVRTLTNPGLTVLGVLPTMHDGRTVHGRDVLADITGRFGVPVLDPSIPRSVRFAEAPAAGRSALTVSPRSRGALAYRELAAKLIAQWGP